MKFTIEKPALLRELALLQQIIDKKSLIPSLSYIRIEASGKRAIRLTGTDLDQTLNSETEGVVQKGGVCALPGKKLFEIVKNLPDASIVFETKENDRAEIKCERSHFKLSGVSADDLPEYPQFKGDGAAQIPSDALRTMIERTRFAITTDESRYTLSGAKFILKKKGVRMVTTDGHRLSLIDNRSITNEREFDCLIPKKALNAVYNLAASHEGAIGINTDDNHIYFEIGTRTLISRLLTGQFPNYDLIIPKQNEQKVEFECSELLQTVRRAAVMSDRVSAINLEFKRKKLRVFTEDETNGTAEETLEIDYRSKQMAIRLNADYLIEYLAIIGSGPIAVEFTSPSHIVQIKPMGEAGYNSFSIIMPMCGREPVAVETSDVETEEDQQVESVTEEEVFAEAA